MFLPVVLVLLPLLVFVRVLKLLVETMLKLWYFFQRWLHRLLNRVDLRRVRLRMALLRFFEPCLEL